MKYKSNSIEELIIKGCKKEEQAAQSELYRRYYSYILNFCMRYTSNEDEALEVLNDAFLKVFRNIKKFRGDGSLAGWIRQIAFRTVLDNIKKNTKYYEIITLNTDHDVYLENDALERISNEEILRCLQQITPASRHVFALHVLEGYDHKTISEMLGISVNTSRWHLSHARSELKKIYSKMNKYLIAL